MLLSRSGDVMRTMDGMNKREDRAMKTRTLVLIALAAVMTCAPALAGSHDSGKLAADLELSTNAGESRVIVTYRAGVLDSDVIALAAS